MTPGPGYRLSRWIWVHHMRIMYAAAGLFAVSGLSGPRDGGLFTSVALMLARTGLYLALVLWLVLQLVRKRTPNFTLKDLVSVPSRWTANSPVARSAYRAYFFVFLALMFACLGAVVGAIGALMVWRLT